MKPIATEISSWHPYKKVIYKCANCEQDFRIFGFMEKYCHNCGTKVDWDDVIIELPEPFNKNALDDYNEEKALVGKINELNHRKQA